MCLSHRICFMYMYYMSLLFKSGGLQEKKQVITENPQWFGMCGAWIDKVNGYLRYVSWWEAKEKLSFLV